MHDRRHDRPVRSPITEEFVRDQTQRYTALRFQQFTEETRGRTSIPAGLDEDVYHVTVLVDGPPEILPAALNVHEQLVQIPRVAQRWTLSAGQLIDIVKWNLLCHIPVKMRGAEDDEEETTKSFTSV